jgi:multidrug efflux pump subunit AcrB
MNGVAQSLFVPLSLAVMFAMIASFLLSSSFLPVLFLWVHRQVNRSRKALIAGRWDFDKFRDRWGAFLERLSKARWLIVGAYAVAVVALILLLGPRLGRELFPTLGATQFRLRFDAPTGTRAEETEQMITAVLGEIQKVAGPDNVAISLGYVGTQGASYPINTVFLWTSGPHEAVIDIALRQQSHIDVSALEEKLRKSLPPEFPGSLFSFEPGDLVSQIMNLGAPTPVEIAVVGPNLGASRAFTDRLRNELNGVAELRDLKYELPLDYPSVDVKMDRELAGQFGVTAAQVARSLADATYSSRFTSPNYWADPNTGIAYQVQVQYPPSKITSLQDVQNIPVMPGAVPGASQHSFQHPLIGDLAQVDSGTAMGEYDRRNGFRMLTLSANIAGHDLGRVSKNIDAALARVGAPPTGTTVQVRGQIAPMQDTFRNLAFGLPVAVLAIFLLLAANFESLRLAFVVLTTAPATICGVILMLLATRTTLNIESYMGTIMAIGVGTANAILLVTFADQHRRGGATALASGIEGVRERMRPILMTSAAMIAGMIPLALAAEVTAPLGRAVIGGLLAATITNLAVLPFVFSIVQQRAGTASPSLDPDDPESRYAAT